MLSVENALTQLEVQVDTLEQALEAINLAYPNLTKKQLAQGIIFLNNKQLAGGKSLKEPLRDGDELTFLSPAGGG